MASDVNRLAVGRDPDQSLLARDRVEPALAVALESRNEIVAGGRRLVGIAHALIKVGFTIAVEVVQSRDLVATQDVNHAAGDHQAERLVQPRGEPTPAHLVQRLVQAIHSPDVSLHGAKHRRTVGQEVMIAEEERGLPGILKGRLDRVDRVGTLLAELALVS